MPGTNSKKFSIIACLVPILYDVNMLHCIPIDSTFNIKVIKNPNPTNLSNSLNNQINSIWNEETKKRKNILFNGKILRFVSFKNQRLIGEFIPYKFFFAQIIDPNLFKILKINTIGTSGVTFYKNNTLVGVRGSKMSSYPLFYELVPSGGIDPNSLENNQINLNKQFATELNEEAGILPLNITPFLFAHDPHAHIYDVCAKIEVNTPNITQPKDEYEKIFWADKECLTDLMRYEKFVPLSLEILNHFPL